MTLPIDIRGCGDSWAVFAGGRQVGTPTNAYEKACIKALKAERDLQRVDRSCLRCTSTFTAEHRHNRLCPECTAFARGAMV